MTPSEEPSIVVGLSIPPESLRAGAAFYRRDKKIQPCAAAEWKMKMSDNQLRTAEDLLHPAGGPDMSALRPNGEKKLLIDTDKGRYARYPIRTHVVMKGDSMTELLDKYVRPYLMEGDQVFLSEKMVSISQGRAFPIDEIKVSRLAKFLVKFVYKSPYGVGLGSPWTMELAIRDIGRPRILFAAFCAAVTKPFGVRGVFYNILGTKARSIDGPGEYVLPPFNKYAKMSPLEPHKVARELSEYLGHDVIDANDLGCEILGKPYEKPELELELVRAIFKDNPLAQSAQQTPVCLVRKVADDAEEPVFPPEEAPKEAPKEAPRAE